MALDQPFPDLDELLAAIGMAGQRLGGINASEGAAGNISLLIGWPLEVRRRFPVSEPLKRNIGTKIKQRRCEIAMFNAEERRAPISLLARKYWTYKISGNRRYTILYASNLELHP